MISMAIRDAVTLLGGLRRDEPVTVTFEGRHRQMTVSRPLHRCDGQSGSYESSRVTVTYGPGRYSREVTAEQMASGEVSIEGDECRACGKRGGTIPDSGHRYCERCLFGDMDRELTASIAGDAS